MAEPFKPKFDLAKIIASAPPKEKKAPASRGSVASTEISNLSKFPSITAMMQYLFANAPDLSLEAANSIMDVEYPWAYADESGNKITEAEAQELSGDDFESLRARVDEEGKIMLDAKGRPVKRAWIPRHFAQYRYIILSGKSPNSWSSAEKLGITQEQIQAAMEWYAKNTRKKPRITLQE